jgi:hypothetical protein
MWRKIMIARLAAAALAVSLSLSVSAETPNINPGMWEYNSTIRFQSDFPIPDQTDTTTECVTEEDILQGDAFIEEMEGCEMTRRELRRDGMDYVMECSAPDGTSVTMRATMDFNGDSASGTITGDMETPMGPMTMNIELQGRRIGDC